MAVTVANYNKKYLRMKPEVKQIFEDLEEFRDFVRLQYPHVKFDEADLYKNSSPIWQKFIRRRAQTGHPNAGRPTPHYRSARK